MRVLYGFRLAMHEINIGIGIVYFINSGIELRTVDQIVQVVKLGYVYELPADQLLTVVPEAVLTRLTDGNGLVEGFGFVTRGYEPELLVELGGVVAGAAYDPENDLGQIPFHKQKL
jgi:hypothetical protein